MKYDAVSFSWAGDKYIGTPYSKMDCQAFISSDRRKTQEKLCKGRKPTITLPIWLKSITNQSSIWDSMP